MDEIKESDSPSLLSGTRRKGKAKLPSPPRATMSIPAIPAGAWIALNAEVDTGLAPVGSFVRALPDDSLAVSVHVSEGKVVKPGVVQMTFSNLASHPSRPVEITMRFLPIEKRRTLPEVTIDDLSEVKFS